MSEGGREGGREGLGGQGWRRSCASALLHETKRFGTDTIHRGSSSATQLVTTLQYIYTYSAHEQTPPRTCQQKHTALLQARSSDVHCSRILHPHSCSALDFLRVQDSQSLPSRPRRNRCSLRTCSRFPPCCLQTSFQRPSIPHRPTETSYCFLW